jgi:glycosyltransferase involved in cell wall biosynthesis
MISGASIRTFNIAKGLNTCGASVCVLHQGATKSFNSRFKFIHLELHSFLASGGNYLHPLNLRYPCQFLRFVKEYKPDIIQCEQPWSVFPTLWFSKYFGIPCVLDEHNVEFIWSKSASRVPFLAHITFAIERVACSYSSLVLASSEVDKRLLMEVHDVSGKKVCVVPNGVNIERYSTSLSHQSQLSRRLKSDSEIKIILFHGAMDAKQNYEAAKLIMNFIAPKFAHSMFVIIGKGSDKLIRKVKSQENVLVLGLVPSIEEYLAAADVCIAPIKVGSGTRLKVLEYLAAGKPIVATHKAVEGLGVIDGVHALLYKDVNNEFVNGLRRILSNQVLREELGKNALKLSKLYDWASICSNLHELYMKLYGNSE